MVTAQVNLDGAKWIRFVRASKLEKLTLKQYYLPNVSAKPTAAEYELLATNLFADAVAVGALVLPDTVSVEDFRFIAQRFSPEEVKIRRKVSSPGGSFWVFDLDTLRRTIRMSSMNIPTLFRGIARGIDELVAAGY